MATVAIDAAVLRRLIYLAEISEGAYIRETRGQRDPQAERTDDDYRVIEEAKKALAEAGEDTEP